MGSKPRPDRAEAPWLLLIHRLPANPAYLRVKVARKLAAAGAVAIKNSVYALPGDERSEALFQRLLKEIQRDGGEGAVCEAAFILGLSDSEVRGLFNRAKNVQYAEIREQIRAVAPRLGTRRILGKHQDAGRSEVARLRRELEAATALDFFGASDRERTEAAFQDLEEGLGASGEPDGSPGGRSWKREELLGLTWVTRKGIHVDRMASAWLVRRFVDPRAKFRFVAGKTAPARSGEVRFDMKDAEFTHEGDRCTFETLLERASVPDPALRPIAEIVHEIDLGDKKFHREETPGIERLIEGVVAAHDGDLERIRRSSAVFDDLYEIFRRKRV